MEPNPSTEEPDTYHAYLLRLWRYQYKARHQWRASLENPHTGERLTFASWEQCFAYLSEQLDDQGPGNPSPGGKPGRQASTAAALLSGVTAGSTDQTNAAAGAARETGLQTGEEG